MASSEIEARYFSGDETINMCYILLFVQLVHWGDWDFLNQRSHSYYNDVVFENSFGLAGNNPKSNEFYEYSFRNDSIIQALSFQKVSVSSIRFQYTVSNSKVGCSRTVSGVANNPYYNMDPALDEDEEGFGYPVDQYRFLTENIEIGIRVELLSKDKVQILVLTGVYNNYSCPLETVGIMR